MRLVIQRALQGATLSVDNQIISAIDCGLMVLVGVECGDTPEDAAWLARKTVGLRVFPDNQDVMNLSILDAGGQVMAVSQFTLLASTRKGNRPSYIRSAPGPEAEPLYEAYCRELEQLLGVPVARGRFGAEMQIRFTNSGPVTIIIDSRLRE